MHLMVSQDEQYAVEYQRDGQDWTMREHRVHRNGGQVRILCLGQTLTLGEIYRGVR